MLRVREDFQGRLVYRDFKETLDCPVLPDLQEILVQPALLERQGLKGSRVPRDPQDSRAVWEALVPREIQERLELQDIRALGQWERPERPDTPGQPELPEVQVLREQRDRRGSRVHGARQVRKVRPARKVRPVRRDRGEKLEKLETPETRDQRARKDYPVLLVLLVRLELSDNLEIPDIPVKLAILAYRDHVVLLGQLGQSDPTGYRVQLVAWGPAVFREAQAPRVKPEKPGIPDRAERPDRQELWDHPVPLGFPVPLVLPVITELRARSEQLEKGVQPE